MHQRDIKFNWRCRGGGINSHKIFDEIISLENSFLAWKEFRRGKRKKKDVQEFEYNLEDNLFQLHHAVSRVLYPIFDKSFIFDSYSCRIGKGTHKAISRLESFCRKLSRNNTKNIFALKCDIKKFFDSIDHEILLNLIRNKIKDENAVWLIEIIIESFEKDIDRGLPLGNVSSQLFANIYLNELDQFIKYKLNIRCYIRYCDDFIILDGDKDFLISLIPKIKAFLDINLKLKLHPDKIVIRKYHQGIDFLGYVVLPHYRVLRTKTKKRILRKIKERSIEFKNKVIDENSFNQSLQSYLGVLKHCKGYKIFREIWKLLMAEKLRKR